MLPSYELFSSFSLPRCAKRKGLEHPFRFVNAWKIKPPRPQDASRLPKIHIAEIRDRLCGVVRGI
jgi:hypothetical protein